MAAKQLREQTRFKIHFVLVNGQQVEKMESEFDRDEDAFSMITYLQSVRPVGDAYYYLYSDAACRQALSYLVLCQSFQTLKIAANSTFYVRKESTPPL